MREREPSLLGCIINTSIPEVIIDELGLSFITFFYFYRVIQLVQMGSTPILVKVWFATIKLSLLESCICISNTFSRYVKYLLYIGLPLHTENRSRSSAMHLSRILHKLLLSFPFPIQYMLVNFVIWS